jgi:hypothetical protein
MWDAPYDEVAVESNRKFVNFQKTLPPKLKGAKFNAVGPGTWGQFNITLFWQTAPTPRGPLCEAESTTRFASVFECDPWTTQCTHHAKSALQSGTRTQRPAHSGKTSSYYYLVTKEDGLFTSYLLSRWLVDSRLNHP